MSKKVVAVSGGFDPIHVGHLRLCKEARALGDELVVIVNNDHWLRAKKGFVFMPEEERVEIIESLPFVDRVILTTHKPDDADRSVCNALAEVRPDIFANGGDRLADNVPEAVLCRELGIDLAFNVGAGGKVQSSSDMVARARESHATTVRPWGMFKTHAALDVSHVKTLHVNPGARLSLQRHQNRDEFWLLLSGDARATVGQSLEQLSVLDLARGVPFQVPAGTIHRIESTGGCIIAEVAYGTFDEGDIERFEDDYGRVSRA